jgi:hypothetical protein
VGDQAFFVLATAAGAAFGLGGVLLGLYVGVRSVVRDEERFGSVSLALETTRADMSRLKVEWGTTLEQLEQLATAVEKGRRRAAASLSAAERKEQAEANHAPTFESLTPMEQRAQLRRQIRGIRGA